MAIETKGQRTRETIVARAAEVFNVRGYAGTSVADILAATGLEKGGLYNHFESKDELALAAFDHALATLRARHREARARVVGPRATLAAFLETFRDVASHPATKGGCPLLNTAVETTDGHPALRKRVRAAFAAMLDDLVVTIERGIACGELDERADPAALASLMVCSLEGAVMLGRLERTAAHMTRVVDHLERVLADLASVGARA